MLKTIMKIIFEIVDNIPGSGASQHEHPSNTQRMYVHMILSRNSKATILFLVLALGTAALYWPFAVHFPEGSLPEFISWPIWAILRGFGPALAAIVGAIFLAGRSGFQELISRLFRWRVSWKLYVLAIAGPLLLTAIATSVAILAKGVSFTPAASFTIKMLAIFFVMAIMDGPLGEEVGWRGFLLPQLLKKFHPVPASIFVGIVWYAWHIPLYAIDGKGTPPIFLFTCVIYSLIFTWFYLKSDGSTLLMILLHNASNYFIYIRRILFPQVQKIDLYIYLYVALVSILGIWAAIAIHNLWRTIKINPQPGNWSFTSDTVPGKS
jgi:membrane protease YdiL (CAAX protease family)